MNIFDPNFRYVPSAQTDIRKTIRREQKRLDAIRLAAEEAQKKADEEAKAKVTKIKEQR